jgi:hypothetical protein
VHPGGLSRRHHRAGTSSPGLFALDEALAYFEPTRERACERYRALTESEEREDLLPTGLHPSTVSRRLSRRRAQITT